MIRGALLTTEQQNKKSSGSDHIRVGMYNGNLQVKYGKHFFRFVTRRHFCVVPNFFVPKNADFDEKNLVAIDQFFVARNKKLQAAAR